MAKKKKEELPDYTVADMDLDGMPWNTGKSWHAPMKIGKRKKNFYGEHAGEREKDKTGTAGEWPGTQEEPVSPEARRYMVWQGLKEGLLIGLVFVGAAFLFILFCLYVWF